jgi:two-component system sensor histidine kinase KdpD
MALSRRRRLSGFLLTIVTLPLITFLLSVLRDRLDLASILLLYLSAVVAVATVGGIWPGVTSALAGSALSNWYFTPPYHTWKIASPHDVIALAVFLVVAATVSGLVEAAARRNAEAVRARSQALALREVDRLRTALLAAVSHDLRTPLSSIKASATSLLQHDVQWTPTATEEFLEAIVTDADRLNALVGNLLDMSRLRTGAVHVHERPVGLDEVLPAALSGLKSPPEAFDIDVAETLPLVDADPALLERVVANLVANALTWSPSGLPVRIEAGTAPGRVNLRVIDRGPGIAREDRQRVFQPFQRLEDRPNGTGVGLGLAVAKGFTEAMGGQLIVDDTSGGGTTMVVSLEVHE